MSIISWQQPGVTVEQEQNSISLSTTKVEYIAIVAC